MRLVVLALAGGLGVSTAQALEASDVVGTWRLVNATREIVETGQIVDAYGGPHPQGWLTYDKNGRMTIICAYEGRAKPSNSDLMTDEERAVLQKSFFAYAGTYTVTGNKISHNIDLSWNETWTGTSQVREIVLRRNQLILRTEPFKSNADGKLVTVDLLFERYP